MNTLLLLAGLGQLGLAMGSLAIPRVLDWESDVSKLRPLTRQVFWTYAGYIWATNVAFGLISSFAPQSLIDGSTLAAAVTGFITVYWSARIIIQFAYFDRNDAPSGRMFIMAEIALITLFLFLAVTYGVACGVNLLEPRT